MEGGFIWPSGITVHDSSLAEKWSLPGIYINSNLQPLITADSGKLFIVGSNNISKHPTVMAFDGNSGNLLWQSLHDGLSISSTESKVIVGGAGKVMALDEKSGEVIWSTVVQARVIKIIPVDSRLYIYGASGGHNYILDVDNGDILEDAPETYTSEPDIMLGNVTYLRNGNGTVLAINEANGQELWRDNVNAISNLVVTSSSIYVLSQDGRLLQFDPQTGNKNNITTFTPSDFLQRSEQTLEFPYYLMSDQSIGVLFVYLGDSAQLFAFQIQP